MLGLIGTPVAHSKSPAMYNHCFAKFGLDWAYLAFDVPAEKAGEAVAAIRTLGMRGANVTMPCKNAVIPYLDELTPAAKAIQAVNTIVNDNGRLVGHNTDGCGYTQSLRRNGVEVAGKKIVLLGGGGAASAIAHPSGPGRGGGDRGIQFKGCLLAQDGAGDACHRQGGAGCAITLHDLEDRAQLKAAIDRCDILSNATRVGMAPYEDQSNITDLSWFRSDLVVTDVVYAPPATKMLREARAAGCKTCDGLGMLLCQGTEAFRLYSGLEMPVEEIRALLYA